MYAIQERCEVSHSLEKLNIDSKIFCHYYVTSKCVKFTPSITRACNEEYLYVVKRVLK